MNICLLTIFLVILYIFFIFFSKKNFLNNAFFNEDRNRVIVFLALVFFTLLIFAIFRNPYGGLSADYFVYEEIFNMSNQSLSNVMKLYPENDIGFLILNKFFRLFTDNFYIFLFVVHSLIIIGYLYFFYKYSKNIWLSVILLVSIGSYYVSFNAIRQFLVIGILLLSSKYLFERNLIKYLICILFLSTVHKSVLIMIPMYYLLSIDVLKKEFKSILIFSFFVLIIFFNLEYIIEFAQLFIYSNYTQNSFGMDKGVLFSIIRPILICLFVICMKNSFSLKNQENRIMFNGVIFFLIISIFSLKLSILTRFIYYFIPFVLVLIPNVLDGMKQKENAQKVVIMVSFMYALITQLPVTDFLLFPF